MSVSIQPATLTDLPDLLTLENACFDADRLSRLSYRRLIHSKSALVIKASLNHTLIGSAVVFLRSGSKMARLYSLAVDAKHRQRGVALALMNAIEEMVHQRNCQAIRLEVRADNQPAIRFYKNDGYEIIGEKPGYYEDGCNALRMQKNLDHVKLK